MDLRDGRRGDGRRDELGEDGVEGPLQVLFDDAVDVLPRLGLHLVAAQTELLDELGREDALSGRNDLAELDVRGAEAFEGLAQTPRDRGA
jgi:hypothetical protein